MQSGHDSTVDLEMKIFFLVCVNHENEIMKLLQSASFTHSFTAQLAKYFTRDGSSTLAGDLRTAKA